MPLFSRIFSRLPAPASPVTREPTPSADETLDATQTTTQKSPSTGGALPIAENESRSLDTGPGEGNSSKGLLFTNAHDFIVKDPIMFDIKQYVRDDRDTSSLVMKKLSEYMIRGAEFDSSAREPPPQCHPGTRVKLIEGITRWLSDREPQENLLWLHGPAGVGKSAIIQTCAEIFASSDRLAATLFFSRSNNRKDPKRILATIAFQLAVRIPSYRAFVTEQFATDPNLLDKGMKEQFRIFVVEPFGRRKTGRDEEIRAILLDGLDECEGEDQQCNVIRLISAFVLEFPCVPLVWVIASRSEPHIKVVFNNEDVKRSHWQECVPIDSTEACRDVEHYLNASFDNIRKQFPDSIPALPSRWPNEAQFLKLTNAAAGLFVFASTVILFIGDQLYGDPVYRLDLVLSIIDKLAVAISEGHPFAILDALYAQILLAVPPSSWRTAKRILGYTKYVQRASHVCSFGAKTLLEISNVLGLEQNVAYGALRKLHSVLMIPPLENAHRASVTFLHVSFADFLEDPSRSKGFHLSTVETAYDLYWCYFRILQHYQNGQRDPSLIALSWTRSKEQQSLSRVLYGDAKNFWWRLLTTGDVGLDDKHVSLLNQQECLQTLKGIEFAQLFNTYISAGDVGQVQLFFGWISDLWEVFSEGSGSSESIEWITLTALNLEHIGQGPNPLVCDVSKRRGRLKVSICSMLRQINSQSDLANLLNELKSRREECPGMRVLVCGSDPGRQFALFTYEAQRRPDSQLGRYQSAPIRTHYCIPYSGT